MTKKERTEEKLTADKLRVSRKYKIWSNRFGGLVRSFDDLEAAVIYTHECLRLENNLYRLFIIDGDVDVYVTI